MNPLLSLLSKKLGSDALSGVTGLLANNVAETPKLSINDVLNYSQTFQPQQQETSVQTAPNKTTNGFLNGIANAFGDFKRGYEENKNNAFSPDNLITTQFTETVQPDNNKLKIYQDQLKKVVDEQGNRIYSDDIINAVAQGKNSGDRDIAKWINANKDAYPTTNYYDKGVWGKVGEGLGTITRFANSPTGQALIAGVASTALTGNPLFGAMNAYGAGSQRAKNNVYNEVLKKYDIEPSSGFFYNMTPTDLTSITNSEYKYNENALNEAYKKYLMTHYDEQDKQKARANDIREQQINNQYNLGKERIAVSKQKKASSSGKKAGKQKYYQDLNKDLGQYASLSAEQQSKVRPKMIEAYGKDFLSQENELNKKTNSGTPNIVVPGL